MGEVIGATLDSPLDVDELLYLICLAALDTVPGVEHAGITIADRRGGLDPRVATDPLVFKADALEYTFTEGPCIDVVRGRLQARTDDLRADVRWPRYGPLAAKLGIASQMGIALVDEPGMVAALNLYSSHTAVFDDDAAEAVMLFAIQVAYTLGRFLARERRNAFELPADRAFEMVARSSRATTAGSAVT